jgi:hypothetical protein
MTSEEDVPRFFVRKGTQKHQCPNCKCREPVIALLFTGFNVDAVREFLGTEGPLVEVTSEGELVVHGWINYVRPGTWLYRELDVGVRQESAPHFCRDFERP